jgi:hypothetical protein
LGAFKRFGPGDQVDNVLILEPEWTLVSGTSGWRGSPEGSASVSLFEGRHRSTNNVTREYRYQRSIPGTDSFGPLVRTGPITASVHFVYMTKDERQILTERSNERWGHEHWKTVEGLYNYYERRSPDYVTSSYDYYCVFFSSSSQNIIQVYDRDSDGTLHVAVPTGSFAMEAWIKPFVTSSVGNSFTILSHNRGFQFYVDGTSGTLGFRTYSGSANVTAYATASNGVVTQGEWHHAAVTFDVSTYTGIFWLDLQNVGTFTLPTPLKKPLSYTGSLNIGAMWSGSLSAGQENIGSVGFPPPITLSFAESGTVFHGFIGETRVWSTSRSWTELSATHNSRITGSALTDSSLLSYTRFDEGPLAFPAPLADPISSYAGYSGGGLMGSGVLNYAGLAQGRADWGVMYQFDDRPGPGWHPNDNTRFYTTKNFAPTSISGNFRDAVASGQVERMLVLTVPAGMYGRRITPNSVRLRDNSFSDDPYGMIRTLVDDGRGGLFISGSVVSSSLNLLGDITVYPSDYDESVKWNKVGNVFYDEGLIVIKDPSLLDFGSSWPSYSNDDLNILEVTFKGDSRIPVKTMMCRIDRGDLNASLNKTFWTEEEDGDRVRRHPSGSMYVTTVGIYNSDHELVGVARLAEPLRVRPRDRMNVKLRLDF